MRTLFLGIALTALAGAPVAAGQSIASGPAGRVDRTLLGVGTTPPGPAPPVDAFFDDSTLHEIRLTINSRDWQTLRDNYLDNTYYPCDFRWRDQVVRNVGIRSRGTGSRSGVKPGLRVDFDRYSTDQKFLGLKSFILRNNSQDPSGIHDRLSMQFFRRMGQPASREAHTRLYVNNTFAGLYTIVESVDKDFLRRSYGENDGYLFKYDFSSQQPFYFEDRGADPAAYVPNPFKPETHESDPRPEAVAEIIRVINRESDNAFRSAIAPYLDLAQFVRHIAIEAFLADWDGFNGNFGTNNFYWYRFVNRDLFTFIPWDKSEAFKEGPSYSIWHNITDVLSSRENRLTARALSYDDLRALFLDTLLACADSFSQLDPANPADGRGWAEREVEREYGQIKDAAAVALEDLQIYSREQFEQAVEDLRVFARQRAAVVRAEVAASR